MIIHVCVWTADGWPNHVCVCGARAVMVLGEDGRAVLVPLQSAPPSGVPHQRTSAWT